MLVTCSLKALLISHITKLDNQILKSRISISIKLKLYNTCILLIFLYGSESWAVTKRDEHKLDVLNQRCLWKLLLIKWYQHVQNDDVRRTTEQHLSACLLSSTIYITLMYKDGWQSYETFIPQTADKVLYIKAHCVTHRLECVRASESASERPRFTASCNELRCRSMQCFGHSCSSWLMNWQQ